MPSPLQLPPERRRPTLRAAGSAPRRRAGSVGLALAAALLLAGGLPAEPEAAVALAPVGPERSEYFALVPAGGFDGDPPAIAVHRRRETPEGWQLEFDVLFRVEKTRVLIVECLAEEGPRHVYREIASGGSRTVLAEWREHGRILHTIESAADGSLREACDARRGAVMPLYLLELLRTGHLTQGTLNVFDPLARGLERLRLVTRYDAGSNAPPEGTVATPMRRTVELLREDGSLAGRYEFHGDELAGFSFQTGGLVARRIGETEYGRLGGGRAASRDRATRIETLEAAARASSAAQQVKNVSGQGDSSSPLAVPGPRRVE